MKRVSTVRTKQGRNISQQRLTIGLDLGDRNSWYCVLDEAGQIHYTSIANGGVEFKRGCSKDAPFPFPTIGQLS